jgi:hypothetical protein
MSTGNGPVSWIEYTLSKTILHKFYSVRINLTVNLDSVYLHLKCQTASFPLGVNFAIPKYLKILNVKTLMSICIKKTVRS